MNTNYDKLAERAERGELSVKPGTVRRGPKAAEEAQRLAEAAQAAASSAQQVATVVQGAVDKFVDEANAANIRLKEACKEVEAVEEKLIQHALK